MMALKTTISPPDRLYSTKMQNTQNHTTKTRLPTAIGRLIETVGERRIFSAWHAPPWFSVIVSISMI